MIYWLLVLLLLVALFFLPVKIQFTVTYRKQRLSYHIFFSVWKKQYAVPLDRMLLKKWQGAQDMPQSVQKKDRKITAVLKKEWQKIIGILLKDLKMQEYLCVGQLQEEFAAMGSLCSGIFTVFSWQLYGVSQQYLDWQKKPEINFSFGKSDTNWQFQCIIACRIGKLMGKGIRILWIFIRKGEKNDAKKRNRNAYANGYL